MMDHRQTSYQSTCRNNSVVNTTTVNRVTVTPVVPSIRPSRKELMDKINQYSFAMNEANLFLDTHPFDADALAYFQKYRELRVEAVKEYAQYYAPLAIDYAVCDKTPWSWVNEPWPWEGVDC